MPMEYRRNTPASANEEWVARAYPFLPANDPDQKRIAREQAKMIRAGHLRNWVPSKVLDEAMAELDREEAQDDASSESR